MHAAPKASVKGNQRSSYLQYLLQNLWPHSPVFLFNLIFEIRFSDALLVTAVVLDYAQATSTEKWEEYLQNELLSNFEFRAKIQRHGEDIDCVQSYWNYFQPSSLDVHQVDHGS